MGEDAGMQSGEPKTTMHMLNMQLILPSPSPLQEALREFRGTVIAVSHDRYFLRQIVNRVVEVKEHKLQDYSGDYSVSGVG